MSPAPVTKVSPARKAALAALMRPAGTSAFPPDPEAAPDPFAGLEGRERALASRLYRGTLQNLLLLDHLIEQVSRFDRARTAPALIWVLRMAAYQRVFLGGVPDYALVQQAVEQAWQEAGPSGARFVNAILRRGLDRLPNGPDELAGHELMKPVPGDDILCSIPTEIARLFIEGYGREVALAVLRSMNEEPARVWLRVNTLRTTAAELLPRLASEGLEVEACEAAPNFLAWRRDGASTLTPWATQAWSEGLMIVQDLGAGLAVELLAPEPGRPALDYCAAPGGKTGQMWEAMQGRGTLVAHEPAKERRSPLEQNLFRLYGGDHRIGLSDSPDGPLLVDSSGPRLFDRVLVDAPCLAFGLARRHPEVRWDGRIKRMREMQAAQRSILADAARHLAPGGRLAWVTCSPTLSENEEIVSELLSVRRDLKVLNPLSCMREAAEGYASARGTTVRTRPDLAPVDGFAITLIGRSPS